MNFRDDPVLDRLATLQSAWPDMRLGQLIIGVTFRGNERTPEEDLECMTDDRVVAAVDRWLDQTDHPTPNPNAVNRWLFAALAVLRQRTDLSLVLLLLRLVDYWNQHTAAIWRRDLYQINDDDLFAAALDRLKGHGEFVRLAIEADLHADPGRIIVREGFMISADTPIPDILIMADFHGFRWLSEYFAIQARRAVMCAADDIDSLLNEHQHLVVNYPPFDDALCDHLEFRVVPLIDRAAEAMFKHYNISESTARRDSIIDRMKDRTERVVRELLITLPISWELVIRDIEKGYIFSLDDLNRDLQARSALEELLSSEPMKQHPESSTLRKQVQQLDERYRAVMRTDAERPGDHWWDRLVPVRGGRQLVEEIKLICGVDIEIVDAD